MTLKGAEMDELRDYTATYKYGLKDFRVFVREGRLWIFRDGSEALTTFLKVGEPAKSVTLIGEGPEGMTVKGAERETLDAYLAAWKAR